MASRSGGGGIPRVVVLLVATVVASALACVDARDRPGGPSEPDDDGGAGSFFVDIVQPEEGDEIPRSEFTREPGLEVSFAGRFGEGDHLLLLVFTDLRPNTAVFASEARVDPDDPPTSARVLMAPHLLDQAAEVEILLRLLRGDSDQVISADSVGVSLR